MSSEQASNNVKNQPVTMLVTFHVKPSFKEEFTNALLHDLKKAKKEDGNLDMVLFEDKEDSNTFYLIEQWKDETALNDHFEQPYTKAVVSLAENALENPMQISYLNDIVPLPDSKQVSFEEKEVDLIVFFDVKKGMEDRFMQQFYKSVKHSRMEDGCIAYHIYSVVGEPSRFLLYERWHTQAALDVHFEQEHIKELFEVFKEVLNKPVEQGLHFLSRVKHAEKVSAPAS